MRQGDNPCLIYFSKKDILLDLVGIGLKGGRLDEEKNIIIYIIIYYSAC